MLKCCKPKFSDPFSWYLVSLFSKHDAYRGIKVKIFNLGFIREPCFAQSKDSVFIYFCTIPSKLSCVCSLRRSFCLTYSSDWWSNGVIVDLPEHHQAASLKIVLVVPNIHQFRMMEPSMQQKECSVFLRSVPQSCPWLLEAAPLTSLLVDFSDTHRRTLINHTWSLENCFTWSLIPLLTVSSVIPSSTSVADQYTLCVALVCRLSLGSGQIDHLWFKEVIWMIIR